MIPNLLPSDLGLPPKFTSWRPGQLKALSRSLDSPRRFIAHSMPVGEGKSLYYIAHALLGSSRTCILTSSKGLQTQLLGDFSPCGLVDMRGRNNYPCHVKEARNCDEGQHYHRCAKTECSYEIARESMLRASLVESNYSYFMLSTMYGRGMGKFDLLVMDESHDAPDEVCAAMAIEVSYWEANRIGVRLPSDDSLIQAWFDWGNEAGIVTSTNVAAFTEAANEERRSAGHVSRDTAVALHLWNRLNTKCQSIAKAEGTGEWIVSRTGDGRRIEPVWAHQHAHKVLFQDIPKVVLTSATMVRKTLNLLGIDKDTVDFHEYPSSFPPRRSPVYLFPPSCDSKPIRIDHKIDEDKISIWLAYIDNVISKRLDRKGIIHTVSYERARLIQSRSEHAAYMIVPGSSRETEAAIESFKRSSPPSILVSPSITTGYDFPGQECEFNLIIKVPFLDTRTPILEARQKEDPEYAPYITAQTITQAHGRSMRGPEDRSETFILDGHILWFIKKFHHLFPFWFHRLVVTPSGLPEPPEALAPAGQPATHSTTTSEDSILGNEDRIRRYLRGTY